MLRRFSVSFVGRIVAALLQVGVFALFARLLGVSGFGYFATVISVTLVAMSVLELGMGARVLRAGSDSTGRSSLTTFALVRAGLIIVLPFAALGYAQLLDIPTVLAVTAAVYAAGEATGDLAVGILQGERRSWAAMAVLVSRRAAALVPILIVSSEQGALVGALSAAAAGIVLFGSLVLHRLARPRSLVSLIRENLGVMFSGGAANTSQLDVAVVNGRLGSVDAGLFASATRLFNPISMLIATLLQVLIPELASAGSGARKMAVFRRARLLVYGFSVALIAASFVAPQIVVLLYGESFAGAAPVAVAVFVGAGLSAVSQIHLAWFYSERVPVIVPALMWVAVLGGLASIWTLSVAMGLVGAAVGLVAMQFLFAASIVGPWFVATAHLRRQSSN
ncbi:oligosaccharide flippase family protein [Microbacter sp. GSS18]|nr:oligosaccharide flippase family protein [Microbacter sp. GSS18]